MKKTPGKKRLRSGFTTGACAAAAAKAAAVFLVTGRSASIVHISFPDKRRFFFQVAKSALSGDCASASIIKDAGDDPDVTNGAEICAHVCMKGERGKKRQIRILGGKGVGKVTKAGLAPAVGGPAINPVPCRMIRTAVEEALEATVKDLPCLIEVTISVPDGERLAEKTLNHRLGIINGLSILGTTGIVRPVSADAWTATIVASMDVAGEAGLKEIVLSTGRTSEKGIQKVLDLPEESYAMMGDYLKFSLLEAAEHAFVKIHLAAMWAKMLKAAMKIPQTHVRHGALEVEQAVDFFKSIGVAPQICLQLQDSNTAREMYLRLIELKRTDIIRMVCRKAKAYCEETCGLPVAVYLVDSSMDVVAHQE